MLRTTTYRDGDPNAPHTPWGRAQRVIEHAPGIAFYSTAGHGGFYLSAARLAQMPISDRSRGWYEEDCESLRVVHAFPDVFPQHNRAMVEQYYNEQVKGKPCWNALDGVRP
jgi:hypothetical protein